MSKVKQTVDFIANTLGEFRQIPGMVKPDGIRAVLLGVDGDLNVKGVASVLRFPRDKGKGTGETVSLSTTQVTRWAKLIHKQRCLSPAEFSEFRDNLAAKHLAGVTSTNKYVEHAIGRLVEFIDENEPKAKTKDDKAAIESAKATLDNLRKLVVARGAKRSASQVMTEDDFDSFD